MEGCERTSRSIVNPNGACAGREAKERTKDDLGTRPRHNLSFILGLATLQTFWCTTPRAPRSPIPVSRPADSRLVAWPFRQGFSSNRERDSCSKSPAYLPRTDDLIRGALVIRGDGRSGLIPRSKISRDWPAIAFRARLRLLTNRFRRLQVYILDLIYFKIYFFNVNFCRTEAL